MPSVNRGWLLGVIGGLACLAAAGCGAPQTPAQTPTISDAEGGAAEATASEGAASAAPPLAEQSAADSGGTGEDSAPAAIVGASDRTEKDREDDSRRQPVMTLEFFGVGRAERVADLGAGAGYTTELLARAVGPAGVVYAQNNKMTRDKYVSESWPERLKRPAMKNVVRMDLEYDSPFTKEATNLDLVTFIFSYHDVIAQGGDRKKLNQAVYRALKPGGHYVIADHAAPAGSGLEAASSLHRIEESIVRKEVEAAGFEFVESADFLRDTGDDPSQPSFSVGFKTNRYIMKFRKPQ